MALALRQDAARQADDGRAAGEEDVDPERELRGVEPPVVPEPLGESDRRDDRGVADAGAAQRDRRAAFESRHLQKQGGSAARVLVDTTSDERCVGEAWIRTGN